MEPAFPPLTNFQSLRDLLVHDKMKVLANESEQSVSIPMEFLGQRVVQVIRWQSKDHVVQFIQPMLTSVPAERLSALEAAVARLNHALAFPGFDLNHEHHLLCF